MTRPNGTPHARRDTLRASSGVRTGVWTLGLALVIALLLAGCGSGSGPGGDGGDGDGDPPVTDTPVELEGEPDDPVAQVTADVEVVVSYGDDAYTAVVTEGDEGRVLRREIEIGLSPEATLAEVEALLDGIDATGIVSMVEGLPLIVVQIPDPGDLDALDDVLDGLRAEPIVLYALRSYEVEDPEPSGLRNPAHSRRRTCRVTSRRSDGSITTSPPARTPRGTAATRFRQRTTGRPWSSATCSATGRPPTASTAIS